MIMGGFFVGGMLPSVCKLESYKSSVLSSIRFNLLHHLYL